MSAIGEADTSLADVTSGAPRMNTDDIFATRTASETPAVSDVVDGMGSTGHTIANSATARRLASPARQDEFALLHSATVEFFRPDLIDALEDPRYASSRSAAYIALQKDVNIATVLPTPSVLDFCLSTIGTVALRAGSARPVEEIRATLVEIEQLLSTCAELAVNGASAGAMHDVVAVDYAYDSDDLVVRWPLSTVDASGFPHIASIRGAVDFVVRCGVKRSGSDLVFVFSKYPDEDSGVPARVAVGLSIVRGELEYIHRHQGRECSERCQPVLAQYGRRLAAFDAATKRVEAPLAFPTWLDLVEWIQLRNYFFYAVLCSSSTDDEDDTSGAAFDDDTWISYFSEARSRCQEVLERVESFHAVYRCGSLASTPSTLLGDSMALRLHLQRSRSTPPAAGTTQSTPSRAGRPTMASPASPSEYLTRTPTKAIDREMFLAARPPIDALYRDPDREHAGLLNLRQCCFLNAFVQLAYAMPTFVSAVFAFPAADALRAFRHQQQGPPSVAVHDRVAHRLQAVFAFMRLSTTQAINPTPLLDAVAAANPVFGDGGQHDPHEFAATVFSSLASAFTAASAADASVADVAAEVEWSRFVESPIEIHSFVKRGLVQTRGAATEAATDVAIATQTEACFLPIYFEASPNTTGAAGVGSGRGSAAMDDAKRLRLASGLPGMPERRVHVDPTAPLDDSAATDEHSDCGTSTTDICTAIDNHFSEPLETAAMADASATATAGRLRWLPCNTNEWPASFFLYCPSRLSGGTTKQFDRFVLHKTLNLAQYRAPAACAGVEGRSPTFRSVTRERALRDKFMGLEALDELQRARGVAASAAATVAHCDAKVPMMRPAAQAFLDAAESGVKIAQQRADAVLDRLRCRCDAQISSMTSASSDDDEFVYDLAAVIVHVGINGDNGHYVCYALRNTSPAGDGATEWCLFDDSNVVPVAVDTVLASEAIQRNLYCVSYVKRRLGRADALRMPPPSHLRSLIEREDMRYQLLMAEALSLTS